MLHVRLLSSPHSTGDALLLGTAAKIMTRSRSAALIVEFQNLEQALLQTHKRNDSLGTAHKSAAALQPCYAHTLRQQAVLDGEAGGEGPLVVADADGQQQVVRVHLPHVLPRHDHRRPGARLLRRARSCCEYFVVAIDRGASLATA